MPSRDQLLRQMREQVHHPATARELIRLLKIPREERATLKRQLTSLVSDGALVVVRGNRYGLADRMDLVVGRLDGHPSGFGFVTPERPLDGVQGDVFVAAPNLKEALHGDRVVVRIERHRPDGRVEGRIVQILERRGADDRRPLRRRRRRPAVTLCRSIAGSWPTCIFQTVIRETLSRARWSRSK